MVGLRRSVDRFTYFAGLVVVVFAGFLPTARWGWMDGVSGYASGFEAALWSYGFSFFPTFVAIMFVLASPVLFWRRLRGRSKWAQYAIVPVALDIWPLRGSAWPVEYGYYVWACGFTLIVIAFWLLPASSRFTNDRTAGNPGTASPNPRLQRSGAARRH